jgi:hypothetical protein
VSRRSLFVSSVIILVVSAFFALPSCEDEPPSSVSSGQTGSGGAGGSGGGCPSMPHPMFTVTITASDGAVPPDTSLAVKWSAGEEPLFSLNDPTTWKTLEEGANVVCDVSHNAPPPTDLSELVCRLWTNGATKVVVSAAHYQNHTETLVALQSDPPCEGPIPQTVEIQLLPETDAGVPP